MIRTSYAALCLWAAAVFSVSAGYTQPTTTPATATDLEAQRRKWDRLEGQIFSSQAGVETRATLKFQAPDLFRLDIDGDEARLLRPQKIIAAENETYLYDATSKRLRRLPYNVAREWWRSWGLTSGGPVNLNLSGFSSAALEKAYTLKIEKTPLSLLRTTKDGTAADIGDETLTEEKGDGYTVLLTARPETGRRTINDYVRFGGGGDRIFYAPYKRPVFDRPEKITLQFDNGSHLFTSRQESAGVPPLALSTTLRLNAKADFPPVFAEVRDTSGTASRRLTRFRYALKNVPTAWPEATFSTDLAPDQIAEDAQLLGLAAYNTTDADTKFNLGMTLWRYVEEYRNAFAAWEAASAGKPKAVAPHYAMYEAALRSRDLGRAGQALDILTKLQGDSHPDVLWRRAELSIQRRDWDTAATTLQTAQKLFPRDGEIKMTLAGVQKAVGDLPGAAVTLRAALSIEDAPASVLVRAAEGLAALSWRAKDDTTANLPATQLGRLAGAEMQLLKGVVPEAVDLTSPYALASLAAAFERAGRDDRASELWLKAITDLPSPDDRPARLHLMALYARRGEASLSLAQYRELAASVPDLKTRNEFQSALISAWRKAFRQSQLKKVLEQRALSTAATEDDARLWLAFQENFGTPDDVVAAINNGLTRFERSAWWRSRQSEYIFSQAAQAIESGPRDRLQRDALDYATQAVTLESDQPYYAIQRAVILTQRATPITAIVDNERIAPLRKIAKEALDEILQKWPNDADVQLAVATQRLALEDANQHGDTIAMLQKALRGGEPSGADRHEISFSARQVLLSALNDDRQGEAATEQFDILFRASRTASEELGVALNFLKLQMHDKDTESIARSLVYFAHESWEFADSQQLMVPLINVVCTKEELRMALPLALAKISDPYARYIEAMMAANTARRYRAIMANPEGAPDNAERLLRAAEAKLDEAQKALEPLTASNDKILATRAAAFLGEQAMSHGDAENGEKWLRSATALEPVDPDLRYAVARARMAQSKNPDKVGEALQGRDDMLRVLPQDFETLSRASRLSDRVGAAGDEEISAFVANMSINAGQATPDVLPADFQVAALFAARANLYANKAGAANSLYNGLADEQWDTIGRAVALIDWEETLRNMDRKEQADLVAKRLEALQLTPQQRNTAENAWSSLNAVLN